MSSILVTPLIGTSPLELGEARARAEGQQHNECYRGAI